MNQVSDIVILLTCTVTCNKEVSYINKRDKEFRLSIYLRSIEQWLSKTDFRLVVVENSGYPFEELQTKYADEIRAGRLELCLFSDYAALPLTKEQITYLKGHSGKGFHELASIRYALHHSKLIKNPNTTHVVKITGRYFIPDLQTCLKEKVSQDATNPTRFIRQQDSYRCELIGCAVKEIDRLFHYPPRHRHVEYSYRNILREEAKKQGGILAIPNLAVATVPRGGSGEVVSFLDGEPSYWKKYTPSSDFLTPFLLFFFLIALCFFLIRFFKK